MGTIELLAFALVTSKWMPSHSAWMVIAAGTFPQTEQYGEHGVSSEGPEVSDWVWHCVCLVTLHDGFQLVSVWVAEPSSNQPHLGNGRVCEAVRSGNLASRRRMSKPGHLHQRAQCSAK